MTASHTKEEADSLYKQSKFIEAINVYNRVIEDRNRETSVDSKKGDLHILHSNRCACHLQVGDVLKALEDANSCIRMSPGWSKGYNRKGSCLLRLSLTDEAILAYEKVLELDSSNTEAINALIRLRGSATRSSDTGTSTNNTAGASQYSTILMNYWNDFTANATRYSKDGFAYLKSFLDIFLEYMRQCYYSAIAWWFSLGDQTKNFIGIGLFVLMLYWLLSPKTDSYRHDYHDDSNLHSSRHSGSTGYSYGSSYNRGGYGGGYHDPSYGGSHDSAYGGGNYYSGGGMSWTTWGLIMLGKLCSCRHETTA